MNEILSFSMLPCLQCLRSVVTVQISKLSSVGHEQDVFFACITAMLFFPSFLVFSIPQPFSGLGGIRSGLFIILEEQAGICKPTGLCTDALLFDYLVIISFPLDDCPETSMIAWTTTPWTLPSNLALVVNAKLEYVKVRGTEKWWPCMCTMLVYFVSAH